MNRPLQPSPAERNEPMETDKIIMYDSDEAAKYETRTVTGWFGRDGKFYGDDERIARYCNSTHRLCQCGELVERSGFCRPCWENDLRLKWELLPTRAWDGTTPICLYNGDEYFFNDTDLDEYCEENGLRPENLMLVHCDPCIGRDIDEDDFADEIPDGGELPDSVLKAMREFNAVLNEARPFSWEPGDRRVIIASAGKEREK